MPHSVLLLWALSPKQKGVEKLESVWLFSRAGVSGLPIFHSEDQTSKGRASVVEL